ncbi:Hypothetical predicted protein [Cloeon dipterum]|uniref:L-Fucosyltransferase n=1 Tax=Cloeon dipterum TaxID=197152 RepID=A0A8S1BYS7_9INSE|nr:Hypothetical predicted protein [Cloeon dipterum]
MISALVKGRLGNVVWSYLSVLVTAKIFNLRPVLHNTTVEFLVKNAFEIESIRIPTLEWLDRKCNMSGWPQRAVSKATMSKTLRSRDDLFQALEKPPKSGLGMLRYKNYVTATEFLVPHFYELKNELVLQKDKMIAAQEELHKTNKPEFEFVSVHVRRTDYMHHMNKVHRNGKVATPKFFHAAMDWLIKELNTTLMFIVISDDRNWTQENNPWWTCPERGKGRQSVVLGAIVAGRLGNVVWSYLSVLLTAQIYGLRPVLHNSTIGFLVRDAFNIDHIRMPTLEWLDQKCNMSGWLDRAVRNGSLCKTFYSRRELHQALEKPPEKGLEMYRYSYFVTTTEMLVPYFYEMKKELVLAKGQNVACSETPL